MISTAVFIASIGIHWAAIAFLIRLTFIMRRAHKKIIDNQKRQLASLKALHSVMKGS